MRRLNFSDATFVRLETKRTPMHVAALLVFEKPEGAPRDFTQSLYEHLRSFPVTAERFTLSLNGSLMSRALAPTVETPESIDVNYHVRHSALPHPGSERQLGELIERLHSTPLVRSRPLWEFHLIEGLERHRFAVYFKIHHALVDGMSAVRLLSDWLREDPAERNVPPPWAAAEASPDEKSQQTSAADVADRSPQTGAGSFFRSATDVGRMVRRSVRTAGKRNEAVGLGAMLATPISEINCAVTGQRRFATQTLPVQRLRRVAKAANATVNDVALALCGTVLREHLENRNALPNRPLTCMVPVGLESVDSSAGNAASFLTIALATDTADDGKRLQMIASATRRQKEEMQALSRSAIDLYTKMVVVPASFLFVTGLAERVPPATNLIISNVRLSKSLLHLEGAPLTGVYPVSAVTTGQALNITLVGYSSGLHVGFTACRDSVPHVQRLAVALPAALERLEKCLGLDDFDGISAPAESEMARGSAEKRLQ